MLYVILLVFVTNSLLILLLPRVSSSPTSHVFHEILEPGILKAHGFHLSTEIDKSLYNAVEGLARAPAYFCGPLDSMEQKISRMQQLHNGVDQEVIFVKKSKNIGCFSALVDSSAVFAERANDVLWSVDYLPPAVKIHHSVLQYFSYITRGALASVIVPFEDPFPEEIKLVSPFKPLRNGFGDNVFGTGKMSVQEDVDRAKEASLLAIEFHPLLLRLTPAEHLAGHILEAAGDVNALMEAQNAFAKSPGMQATIARINLAAADSTGRKLSELEETGRILSSSLLASCSLPSSVEIAYYESSVELSNLSGMDSACLFAIIQLAAAHPSVSRVVITGRPQLMNFEARGIMQTGNPENEPFRDAGLTGLGQVCGVSDSGVNDLSCFFLDDSKHYPSPVTNRSGVVEPLRRKIIQYTSYADSFDEEGGHGTHVCGTIVGDSQSEFSHLHGHAPGAKISFFDIGVTSKNYLVVPVVTKIFETAYKSGARVHTNSWGNNGGLYGQISTDVDKFLVDHPDSMVLYSAGNNGMEGLRTVSSPGNSKNALTVGAAQTRTVFEDNKISADSDQDTRLACFSSIGPTADGRIKPDIVGPGDFIQSAYSGPVALMEAALGGGKTSSTCAVHQMSGTSMATPATAGNALLIRQFFIDPRFWASLCDRDLSHCLMGPFEPTGYLLKAIFLHSGEPIKRYSDPVYDAEPTRFPSFELKAHPLDVFQGHGMVRLSNVLPLPNGGGLDDRLDLYVWDELKLYQHETIHIDISLPLPKLRHMNVPMKVTICWFDPPSPMGSVSSLLLHDIDLVVQAPDGSLHWGNANTARSSSDAASGLPEFFKLRGDPSRSNASTQGFSWSDDTNPNEQVLIDRPYDFCRSKTSNNGGGGGANSDNNNKNKNNVGTPHVNDNSKAGQRRKFRGKGLDAAVEDNVEPDIEEPQSDVVLDLEDCVFSVYVHSNALLASPTRSQNIAVVITTAGIATNPVKTLKWFSDNAKYNPPAPTKPRSTYVADAMRTHATLAGGEFVNITHPILDVCTVLYSLDVYVQFRQLSAMAVSTSPSNLEVTIVDPSGKAVSLGGADSSVGIARITTEWPDSWLSRTNGIYTASITIEQAQLRGSGNWKMYVMNSWSVSPHVDYNVTVALNFEGVPRWASGYSCAPTSAPTLAASSAPTASMAPSAAPTEVPEFEAEYVIPFNDISLGVMQTETGLHQQRILLHEFNFTGYLNSVEVELKGSRKHLPLHGTDAWLLAVAVSDPSGLVAQVGGWKWLKQDTNFYSRRWPDPWIGRDTHDVYRASRDVHAAGLHNRSAQNPHHHDRAPPHRHDTNNKYDGRGTVNNTGPPPTAKPTKAPTSAPTKKPTAMPTTLLTPSPSAYPTKLPSHKPTWYTYTLPEKMPTTMPTKILASMHPSKHPTLLPTYPSHEHKHKHKHGHNHADASDSTNEVNDADDGYDYDDDGHSDLNPVLPSSNIEPRQPLASVSGGGVWTVVLAMGWPWGPRASANYTGKVILHFSHTLVNGTVEAIMNSGKSAPPRDKDEGADNDDTGYGARNNDDYSFPGDDRDHGNDHNHRWWGHWHWPWHWPWGKNWTGFKVFAAVVGLAALVMIAYTLLSQSCCPWGFQNAIFLWFTGRTAQGYRSFGTNNDHDGLSGVTLSPRATISSGKGTTNKTESGSAPCSARLPDRQGSGFVVEGRSDVIPPQVPEHRLSFSVLHTYQDASTLLDDDDREGSGFYTPTKVDSGELKPDGSWRRGSAFLESNPLLHGSLDAFFPQQQSGESEREPTSPDRVKAAGGADIAKGGATPTSRRVAELQRSGRKTASSRSPSPAIVPPLDSPSKVGSWRKRKDSDEDSSPSRIPRWRGDT